MANIEFAGFVYTDAGVAIENATINLYDRNTTTPVRATTTTNASGYWSISHATEGRFDIEIVNGTTTRRIKYDNGLQVQEIETANLLIRNPANTFKYDIVPAAITADRTLNLPLITGTATLATTGNLLTRAGGNTTEATSTSTSAVDLLSVSSLNIAAAAPIFLVCLGRKTSGAVAYAGLGLKLNTTVVGEADITTNSTLWLSSNVNAAQSGVGHGIFGPRVTNYLTGGIGIAGAYPAAGGEPVQSETGKWSRTASAPTAAITDVVVRSIVGSASVTIGADELQVYEMPTG